MTSFTRLLLVDYIRKISGKKLLFVVATEQMGARYSADFERLFDINVANFPYQNISPYETLIGNIYDYQKQIDILRSKPDVVFAPVKALTEKFPNDAFFKENSLILKIGDNITRQVLLQKLIKFGYKRSTMVSDIGEFSIRGDIADIYSGIGEENEAVVEEED